MATEITPATLQALFWSFKANYLRGYESVRVWWPEIAMRQESTSQENVLSWLMQLPTMREWIGDRIHHSAPIEGYRLANKAYELSVAIKKEKLEDDQYGQFGVIFQAMGEQVVKYADRGIAPLLGDYANQPVCFDGKAFFATDHPVNLVDTSRSTYSNLKTSKALTYANYVEQRAAFRVQKGPNGQPMGLMPDTLIVPPELEETARSIVGATNVIQVFGSNTAAAARENPMQGTARVVVLEELSGYSLGSTTWYLAQTGRAVKPFIFQERKAPMFVSRTNLTDDNVYEKNEFQYGVDARAGFGYSFPFLCFRCEA